MTSRKQGKGKKHLRSKQIYDFIKLQLNHNPPKGEIKGEWKSGTLTKEDFIEFINILKEKCLLYQKSKNLNVTECYFTSKKDTTSATICANCGKDKMLHTIGEGMRVNKIVTISN